MTGCPNDDPNFTNFLTKLMHHSPSAQERKRIFYLVCIVVRLILLILLYYYRNNNNVRYIVLFLAIYAIYNLSAGIKNTTSWWSKKFQLIMSILIVISSVLVIYNKIDSIYLPVLFGISLLIGFLQSLSITFC